MNESEIRKINTLIAEIRGNRDDLQRVDFCCKVTPLLAAITDDFVRGCFIARAADAVGVTRDAMAFEVARKMIRNHPRRRGNLKTKGSNIMDKNYLELLEKIKDTLSEIQGLREDLDDLLDNPGITLENLEKMRDTLSEIQGLKEDLDE